MSAAPSGQALFNLWALFICLFPFISLAQINPRLPNLQTIVITLVAVTNLYLITLAPLLQKGILSHGWEGSYFTSSCRERQSLFVRYLKIYADRHEGRLPAAATFGELVAILKPMMKDEFIIPFEDHLEFCPQTIPYSHQPTRFEWNASCSGTLFSELTALPIRCPENFETAGFVPLLCDELGIKLSRKTENELHRSDSLALRAFLKDGNPEKKFRKHGYGSEPVFTGIEAGFESPGKNSSRQ